MKLLKKKVNLYLEINKTVKLEHKWTFSDVFPLFKNHQVNQNKYISKHFNSSFNGISNNKNKNNFKILIKLNFLFY